MAVMPLSTAIKKAYTGRATQEQIAEAIGVKQPTISRWARGEVVPDVDQLVAMEDFLERPRGFVLAAAGYVVCPLTVEAAIAMAPGLTDGDRGNLIALYQNMVTANRRADEGLPEHK